MLSDSHLTLPLATPHLLFSSGTQHLSYTINNVPADGDVCHNLGQAVRVSLVRVTDCSHLHLAAWTALPKRRVLGGEVEHLGVIQCVPLVVLRQPLGELAALHLTVMVLFHCNIHTQNPSPDDSYKCLLRPWKQIRLYDYAHFKLAYCWTCN